MKPLTRWFGKRPLSDPRLYHALVLVFVFSVCATHPRVLPFVKVVATGMAIAALLVPALAQRFMFWLLLAYVLSLNLVPNYEYSANHYWLTVYTILYVAFDRYLAEKDLQATLNVPRGLLVVTFGAATLQKLISPYFMSGRLLGDYFLQGTSLNSLWSWYYPGFSKYVEAYRSAHDRVAAVADHEFSLPVVLPGEDFVLFCQAAALTIVGVEALLFVALLAKRTFEHRAMPGVFLSFIWGTLLFRQEYAFFSLLCLLFLAARPAISKFWKLLLVLSITAFLSVMVGWR